MVPDQHPTTYVVAHPFHFIFMFIKATPSIVLGLLLALQLRIIPLGAIWDAMDQTLVC